jgi:protein ImuA
MLDHVPVLFFDKLMQTAFDFKQAADLRSIWNRLSVQFGRIPDGERLDPVSQFVCSFLGSRTYDQISWNAFARLVTRYQSWDAIADAPEADIHAVIRDVKYAEKKAPELKRALQDIRVRYGRISFDFLVGLDIEQALFLLKQIHGVGPKISAATLNFSTLRGRTFVVDTHVLRVLQRFGFVGVNASVEDTYDAVMAAADDFDADDLRELHWYLKSLGQKICTYARALCVSCPLSDICSQRAKKITALRASLAESGLEKISTRIPLGHSGADLSLKGGIERGALHEVSARVGHEASAAGFTTGLASRTAPRKHLLWIRQDFSALEFGELSATGFLEFGIDPGRMLLLCVADAVDALRAANDALSCAALGAVVIEIPGRPKILDLMASRRLTLACAQKSVTAFLLRFNAQPEASTAETRWLVRAAASPPREENWGHPVFEADLVRNRHGRTGEWVMEWSCDDGLFKETDRGAVVSAPSDRSAATARKTASL